MRAVAVMVTFRPCKKSHAPEVIRQVSVLLVANSIGSCPKSLRKAYLIFFGVAGQDFSAGDVLLGQSASQLAKCLALGNWDKLSPVSAIRVKTVAGPKPSICIRSTPSLN